MGTDLHGEVNVRAGIRASTLHHGGQVDPGVHCPGNFIAGCSLVDSSRGEAGPKDDSVCGRLDISGESVKYVLLQQKNEDAAVIVPAPVEQSVATILSQR